MKKLVLLITLSTFTSCVVHTPSTNTRLEIGHEEDKGVFVSAKPFDSDKVTGLFVELYNWIFE